jgi:autotransporter-associated beta strand protein
VAPGYVLAGTTASVQGNITDNGTVTFTNAGTGTYAGVLSGTGALAVTGPGTLVLTGANSYSGGTLVTAGTVRITSDANLGTSGQLALNGGTLQVGATYTSALAVTLGLGGGAIDPDGNAPTFTGAVTGTGPWYWSCYGTNGGTTASCAAPLLSPGSGNQYPQTAVHYAPNGNFASNGSYLPGADGFNLADVSSLDLLNSLPAGVKGLVWLGMCNGADSTFVQTVRPFMGNPKLFGFYLVDEPDPTGRWNPLCPASNLKAEADWIRANAPANVPRPLTFIVLMNMGTPINPDYSNTYNSANTDIDLFGLDPYPCQNSYYINGCNYNIIPAAVAAAEASGITASQIVPVYQAFGGGNDSQYLLPTATQEVQILETWALATPGAVFDYAFSWGAPDSNQSIVTTSYLQTIFTQKNAGQTLP